jgi:small GTP-binding protein
MSLNYLKSADMQQLPSEEGARSYNNAFTSVF